MSLDELMRRARIWRGGELSPRATQASGFAALDAILPGFGWPQTGVTEIHAAATGIGALQLVLPALAALSRQGHWIVWVNPPYQLYAPALSAQGLDLARLLVVDLPAQPPGSARDEMLWAYEQALRFTACGAALAWFGHVPPLHLRRLQLAAEAGGTWGVAFRPVDTAEQASPALLRLALEAVASEDETGPAPIEITLLKARGGGAGRRCRLNLDAA